MMMLEHLASIFEHTRNLSRVLDVGGGYRPLNTATHILDIVPYRSLEAGLSADEPIRFNPATYVVHDMCRKPWPFPDGFFDYSFCAHTLEDVRDPVGACEELMRVSHRGYIEVPSRLREVFHYKSGYLWRRLLGRPLRIGYGHHRWLCEAENGRDHGRLTFTVKPGTLAYSRNYFITRDEIGRDLTVQEANIAFFWRGCFDVCERVLVNAGDTEADFIRFKRDAMAALARV
jgi:Methyltransferase domain